MPSVSARSRPESRTSSTALSVVANAVQGQLDDVGISATARSLGQPKTTLYQWGADLTKWPSASLLSLAQGVPAIGDAIITLIHGDAGPEAQATAAVPEAYATGRAAAALMREIMEDVEDGRFTRAEADRIAARIDDLADLLPKLRRDVKAAAVK